MFLFLEILWRWAGAHWSTDLKKLKWFHLLQISGNYVYYTEAKKEVEYNAVNLEILEHDTYFFPCD